MKILKVLILSLLILTSALFILGGGVNYGFSRFFLALPFIFLGGVCALYLNRHIFFFMVVLSFSAIATNITLEYNPLFFPVLTGEVEILQKGFYGKFSDGSGGFFEAKTDDTSIEFTPLKAGQKYKIQSIGFRYPDFYSKIEVITDLGPFDQKDEAKGFIRVSKPWVEDSVATLGNLMYYPAYLMMLFQ